MAAPLVSLCARLRASPAAAVPKGKDVWERRGNQCGPADLLARELCRAGDLGPVPGSCPALAACLCGGESRSAVRSQQWGTGIPRAAARAQTSSLSQPPNPALGLCKMHPRLFRPAPGGGLALGSAWSKPHACCEVRGRTLQCLTGTEESVPCGGQGEGLPWGAMFLPCPAAELLWGEGRMEEL